MCKIMYGLGGTKTSFQSFIWRGKFLFYTTAFIHLQKELFILTLPNPNVVKSEFTIQN